MKVTMSLTLDGLVRALRWKSLDLAERAQHGYVRKGAPGGQHALPPRLSRKTEDDDDRSRR
jgi:hypothetical protein